jgi:hypothetical protein
MKSNDRHERVKREFFDGRWQICIRVYYCRCFTIMGIKRRMGRGSFPWNPLDMIDYDVNLRISYQII